MTDGQFFVFLVLIPTLLIVTVWVLARDTRKQDDKDELPSGRSIYTNGHWR